MSATFCMQRDKKREIFDNAVYNALVGFMKENLYGPTIHEIIDLVEVSLDKTDRKPGRVGAGTILNSLERLTLQGKISRGKKVASRYIPGRFVIL